MKEIDAEIKAIEQGEELEEKVKRGEELDDGEEAIYEAWEQNKGKLSNMNDVQKQSQKDKLAQKLRERQLTRQRRVCCWHFIFLC